MHGGREVLTKPKQHREPEREERLHGRDRLRVDGWSVPTTTATSLRNEPQHHVFIGVFVPPCSQGCLVLIYEITYRSERMHESAGAQGPGHSK